MKTGQDPEMMQSAEEHQEIPTADVAIMPVEEPRQRRRVRKLAAKRRQKPKERTRRNCGSRQKKLAADGIRTTHPAKVAWRRGTRSQATRPGQCRTKNPERMDVQDDTVKKAGMQI
jgi:hypothetical protein